MGSFLSVLYSVESNTIGNLTSNADGDTLYFLQSADGNSTPNIMMTSINNFNPVVVGSVPCQHNQLRQFKYFNGDFYYLNGEDLIVISNGSPSVLNTNQNAYCFSVNSSGVVYVANYNAGYFTITGTDYSGPQYQILYDIDASESENRIYFWRNDQGGQIAYMNLNNSSQTILLTQRIYIIIQLITQSKLFVIMMVLFISIKEKVFSLFKMMEVIQE